MIPCSVKPLKPLDANQAALHTVGQGRDGAAGVPVFNVFGGYIRAGRCWRANTISVVFDSLGYGILSTVLVAIFK